MDNKHIFKGRIEVICGSMFSGKTEELIRRIKKVELANEKYIIFRPKIDSRNPENKIIVTGCAAQINPKKYHTLKEVDLVLGNKEKLLSDVWSELNFSKPIQVDDILLEKKNSSFYN